MALEKGKENKENAGENKPETDLAAIVLQLKQELAEVRKKQENPTQQGLSTSDIVKIGEAFTKKQNEASFEEAVDESEIDTEDYEKEGVTFSAPYVGYMINDDVRKGRIVRLPNKKRSVFFDYHAERRFNVPGSKHEQKISFSTYTSHSKKEIIWLREHTLYNTMFFEAMATIQTSDVMRLTRLAKNMTLLKNTDNYKLVQYCREYNIAMGGNIDVIRTELAVKMTDNEMAAENRKGHENAADLYKRKELLNKL
jgi:hypothetical protein